LIRGIEINLSLEFNKGSQPSSRDHSNGNRAPVAPAKPALSGKIGEAERWPWK